MVILKKHVTAMALALLLPYYAVGAEYYSLTLKWPFTQTTPYQFYGNGKQQAPFVGVMCVPVGYKVQWDKVSFYDKNTMEHYGTQFTPNSHVVVTDEPNSFSQGIFNPPRAADTNVSTKDEKQGAYEKCPDTMDTAIRKLYLMSDHYDNDLSVCASYKDESFFLELDSCDGDALVAKTIAPFKYVKMDYSQSNISQDRRASSSYIYIKTVLKFLPMRNLPSIKTYPSIDQTFSTGGIGEWSQCFRGIVTSNIDKGIYTMVAFFPASFYASECDEGYTAETAFKFTDEYGNSGDVDVELCFDQTTSCRESPASGGQS